MQNKITSLTNPRIKKIVRLKNCNQRKKYGLIIVDGRREILRALDAGIKFTEAYFCLDTFDSHEDTGIILKKFKSLNIPIFETTENVFSKISYGDLSQGIVAVCEPPRVSLDNICDKMEGSAKGKPLFVVVEGVEKPGNLGAIIRTCDGAGVEGIIVCEEGTDLYNPNVIRASLGIIFSIKVIAVSNKEALEFLKARKIKICVATPAAKNIYTQTDFNCPLAIAVGSEQSGLSDFWIQHADMAVRIPMNGKADSLNVSASTAVLLYEAMRQKSI